MNIHTIWQCATTSRRTREREAAAAAQYERVHREGALRDDFARRTHELEAQIAQAHAENCRLRAENRALLNSVLGIAGIPPVIVNDPPSATGKPGAALPPFSNEHDRAGEVVAPNGKASPRSFAGRSSAAPLQDQSPVTSTPLGTNTAPPQKQPRRGRPAPHPRNDPRVIAPIRRRSWHQIYRMLEFESSRHKEPES